jgi:hypothetical protein
MGGVLESDRVLSIRPLRLTSCVRGSIALDEDESRLPPPYQRGVNRNVMTAVSAAKP